MKLLDAVRLFADPLAECSACVRRHFLQTLQSDRPRVLSSGVSAFAALPRKEVIQPHLPIRLPCYDFTPVIGLALGGWLLAVASPTLGTPNSHGVTGGVYKARERIHRSMLICDY